MKSWDNLVEMQEHSCKQYADLEIFGTKINGEYVWKTYREFGEAVDQLRAGLSAAGVKKDDKVSIIARNSFQWAVCAYATYGLGAHFVPMYENQTVDDWRYINDNSGARAIFCFTKGIYTKVSKIKFETISPLIICIEDGSDCENSYSKLIAKGKATPVPSVKPHPQELMGLIYTSGTTGSPKGVMLSHRNILTNIEAIYELFDFTSNDRTLAFLPWAHIFGQVGEVHMLIAFGFSTGFAENPATIIDNLAEVKPTCLFAVPRIFNRLYDSVHNKMSTSPKLIQKLFHRGLKASANINDAKSQGLDGLALMVADKLVFSKIRDKFGGNLKFVISGAAALEVEIAKFLQHIGIKVYEGYGLSETSPIISCNSPANHKIGTVGKTVKGVRIKLGKLENRNDQAGEIIAYGPNVMQGYHLLDKETEEVLLEDGGFRTGDIGSIDSSGFLTIVGRIKEQYKLSNGKYVVPTPLEEKIKLSPYISQALIFGDNRPHNVALICVEPAKLKELCSTHKVEYSEKEVNHSKAIKETIRDELLKFHREAAGYEKVRNYHLLLDDWTPENGLMTPSLKLKRHLIISKYQPIIDGFYDS